MGRACQTAGDIVSGEESPLGFQVSGFSVQVGGYLRRVGGSTVEDALIGDVTGYHTERFSKLWLQGGWNRICPGRLMVAGTGHWRRDSASRRAKFFAEP
jgi:hypothetical protein